MGKDKKNRALNTIGRRKSQENLRTEKFLLVKVICIQK